MVDAAMPLSSAGRSGESPNAPAIDPRPGAAAALRLRMPSRPASNSSATAPIAAGFTHDCSYQGDTLRASGCSRVFASGVAGEVVLTAGFVAIGSGVVVAAGVGEVASAAASVVPGVVAEGEVEAAGVVDPGLPGVAGVGVVDGVAVVPAGGVDDATIAGAPAGVVDDDGVFASAAVLALPQMSSLESLSDFAGAVVAGVVDADDVAVDGVVVGAAGVVAAGVVAAGVVPVFGAFLP
jgi:hypothetical protein